MTDAEMLPITALISHHDGYFTIEKITRDLETYQKIVGGYIEAVTAPNTGVTIYCDEEGKLQGKKINRISTARLNKLIPGFASHDVLVGPILWLGSPGSSGYDRSLPLEHRRGFVDTAMSAISSEAPVIVVRQNDDFWVYDTIDAVPQQIEQLERQSEESGWSHPIEVLFGITKGRWQEMRVEVMDHPEINLRDERFDKSYG